MSTRWSFLLCFCFLAANAHSQTVAGASPIADALQSSLAAMLGRVTVRDVALNGMAKEPQSANNDDSGMFTFKATEKGASHLNLNLSSGDRTETREMGPKGPIGAWSRGDGNQHRMASQNLMTTSDWLFPALVLTRMLQRSSIALFYAGQSHGLLHFWACKQPAGAPKAMLDSLRHLTRVDIWLDAKTLLPAKLEYNTHPDNNAAVDIPVRVTYSGYQKLGGVLTPSRVKKFFNGTIQIDMQVQSVTLNSGLPASDFDVQ